ncbi:uncharacterized protein LOC132696553 [Cylas formicarius]|uniref:uncharacterized protein LOC132696553 n=1 Tax=Cylas formicarius TaxID=197179 RepID=UPI0029588549|nr:uncharacterized protein LOC132696553 [Cylas formicarius]
MANIQDSLRNYFFIDQPVKAVAGIAGWIGIIARTIAAIVLMVLIGGTTGVVIRALFGTLLTYILLTLIANLAYIWGIYVEHKPYMFPYLVVVPLEISLTFVVSITVSILMYAIMMLGVTSLVSYIFLYILLLGVHYILWFCSLLSYIRIQEDEPFKLRNNMDHFAMYDMR